MGWLKLLLNANNAEGTREAMRMAYNKHFRPAKQKAGGSSPHHVGLYGALGSRYAGRGQNIPEPALWGELSPFMLMEEDLSVEALAEYVLYQERPWDADTEWLKSEINKAFRSAPKTPESPITLALTGVINKVAWLDLLDKDVQHLLGGEIDRMLRS